MTDPKRPRDPDPLADDAFDAALGARLRAGREDTATLSAAVLSRLAQDPRQTPPGRWLTWLFQISLPVFHSWQAGTPTPL